MRPVSVAYPGLTRYRDVDGVFGGDGGGCQFARFIDNVE